MFAQCCVSAGVGSSREDCVCVLVDIGDVTPSR